MIPILSEVTYLHPSMFTAWDFHIRKGIVVAIDGDNYTVDPSKSQCYGHQAHIKAELINPSPETIERLRGEGKKIEEFKHSPFIYS